MITEFRPVVLRMFTSAQHAHLARSILETHGIRAAVTGDQLSDTLSIYGNAVAKVELLVDASTREEADRLLDESEIGPRSDKFDRWGISEATHWRCPNCSEVNGPAFDECWGCETPRPENPELVTPEIPEPPPPDGTSRLTEFEADSESPYRTPQAEDNAAVISVPQAEDNDPADRAMRAAIFSLFFPLPIAFFGFYLCVQSWGRTNKTGKSLAATLICTMLSILAMFLGLELLIQVSRAL